MEFKSPPLTVVKASNLEQATSNLIYVSEQLYGNFATATNKKTDNIYVELQGYIFILAPMRSLAENSMIISGVTRSQLKISLTMDHPELKTFYGGSSNYLATNLQLRVKAPRLKERFDVNEKELGECIIEKYRKHIWSLGQEVFFNFKGVDIVITVTNIDLAESDGTEEKPYGMLFEETDFEIKSKTQFFKVKSKSMKSKNIFNKKFNFGDLGVGGMDEQIMVMFRRAFATRRLPSAILE
jgi:hypothetical protein